MTLRSGLLRPEAPKSQMSTSSLGKSLVTQPDGRPSLHEGLPVQVCLKLFRGCCQHTPIQGLGPSHVPHCPSVRTASPADRVGADWASSLRRPPAQGTQRLSECQGDPTPQPGLPDTEPHCSRLRAISHALLLFSRQVMEQQHQQQRQESLERRTSATGEGPSGACSSRRARPLPWAPRALCEEQLAA